MYKMSCSTLGAIGTNCYTIINEATNEAILIDATGTAEGVLRTVKKAGAIPVALLLTHAHFDHMDAAEKVKEEYPDMKIYIGVKDAPLLGDPSLNLSYSFMGIPVTMKATDTVSDGEELQLIGINIRCLEVPGHTIGGMCYYMPELKALFDGDTLFHGSVGRSDFPTGDAEVLLKGIEDKLLTLPEETSVFPGHDSETTIGWEKRNNLYFI